MRVNIGEQDVRSEQPKVASMFASLANQTKGDGITLNSVRIETLKCEKETDFVCTVKTVSGLLLVGGQSVVCCRITNDKIGVARCIWSTQTGRTTMLLV